MNTTIDYVNTRVIPAALWFLPAKMDSAPARAMLLAIGLQESAFKYRAQVGGPALGFWEFENGGGFRGVITHPATKGLAAEILLTMCYGAPDPSDFEAIRNNDILACAFARLLLWTGTRPLPASEADADEGWQQYASIWRPGMPHPEKWGANFRQAWAITRANNSGGKT